jgi:hypothetical protein
MIGGENRPRTFDHYKYRQRVACDVVHDGLKLNEVKICIAEKTWKQSMQPPGNAEGRK